MGAAAGAPHLAVAIKLDMLIIVARAVGYRGPISRRRIMKHYPDTYQPNDFVFFLHIPKTAGTSVTNALKAAFPEERTLTPYQMNNVRKHPREIYLQAELLYGHFTHEVYGRRLPKQPDFIVTFLRKPLEHFISTFFHLKIDPTFAYTTRLTDDKERAEAFHAELNDMDIEAFLEHPDSRLFDNFQTRYLVKGLTSDYDGFPDEQLLPIAQRLLLDLPFFGLTERFDDSLSLLASTLGSALGLKSNRSNRSRNKPRNYTPSPEVIQAIEQRTFADNALYALANQAFDARLGASQARADNLADSA
jgi:hypothetical protein